MGSTQSKLIIAPKPPTVIMMTGLQGAGKTTHSAKLAALMKKEGKSPLLVACDVYRPAAVQQLKIVGEKVGSSGNITLELSVAPDDMGKVIGKHGRIAQAIRQLMKTATSGSGKKITVDIR